MQTTRRRLIHGSVALASVAGLGLRPRQARAQDGGGVVRFVPYGALQILDPIWTTANVTQYHGALVYDTLFGNDAQMKAQPQMVESWTLSDDRLVYSFKLRDGLTWHDGTAVTGADCAASVKRWAGKAAGGQQMMKRAKDIRPTGKGSFEIRLTEPYGLVIDLLAETIAPTCFMMREKDAATDPNTQIKDTIGSGPFRFVAEKWVPGSKVFYEKNTAYVPRKEPPSGMAGGKVVHIDGVEWDNMADAQTALAALQAGEIDFYETPPLDLLSTFEGDPDIKIEVLNKLGNVGELRMNHLQPPFDKVEARRAMLHLVDQKQYMQAAIGNPEYYRICGSLFGCGTPMENDAALGWMKTAPDYELAKELLKKAGYDGRPVVILQPTDVPILSAVCEVTAQLLRKADVNVQLAASDWGGLVTRRTVKGPVDQGGWNIFHTYADGVAMANPIALSEAQANGLKGWYGWPSNEKQEQLRDEWAAAPSLDARQKIARELQQNGYDFVLQCVFGQWVAPVAHRAVLTDILGVPGIIPFWGMKKAQA
jgi:peptide/nickel transport system substrate-binding protein